MPRKSNGPVGHTGQTEAGHTRDVKIERVGPVTIYKRGSTYYLYYREGGVSRRQKIDGNLAVARATASKVAASLADGRPSPIGFRRTTPTQMVSGFLDYITDVQKLALRTQDRYRAALERFLDFARAAEVATVDAVDERTVEEFVKWLRGQMRARNGSPKGKRDVYKTGGIKFILSTCRTACNWAGRRRMMPPYAANPFTSFPIDKLRDRDEGCKEARVFSPTQERAFFAACSGWQRPIFLTLATYGLRVGELTHLLIEDVDFESGSIKIRSKPEMFWRVKSGRRRELPLVPGIRELLERLIGDRKAGFIFLNKDYATGKARPITAFASPKAFQAHLQRIVVELVAKRPDATERDKRRAVTAFCRAMGQVPEKRGRGEFMKLTQEIGCPEFTRAHDLRHLFSSRAQEAGMNPLIVQELLGHASLDMTRRYTHIGLDVKRTELTKLNRVASSAVDD
jgi:integrase